jgi:hypothetical protein
MPSIPELTRSSSLIFTGTVVQVGASTVPRLQPSEDLVTVRVDRGLRVDPVLGDLQGKTITVASAAPGSLSPGQKAIFFTQSWMHGQGIAVREVGHLDAAQEASVAAAVAQLPQTHLRDRLRSAELVVQAEVVRINPVERTSFERNAALWAAAELKIETVLRGKPPTSVVVYFPTSNHPMWARAPRFAPHQRGIFILHAPNRDRTPSEATLGPDALVALDPADFQPDSRLDEVRQMLGTHK